MRWKAVFLPAKEFLGLAAEVDSLVAAAALVLACSAFSRSAASFWAFGPRPLSFGFVCFGMKLLMLDILSWAEGIVRWRRPERRWWKL